MSYNKNNNTSNRNRYAGSKKKAKKTEPKAGNSQDLQNSQGGLDTKRKKKNTKAKDMPSDIVWSYSTPGIPDDLFERIESIPITKEEVRAIQISKARLSHGATVYDVGCGSGSISVEAALQIGKGGRVYAVDMNPEAVSLAKENASKFKVGDNITVIRANAVQKIKQLPDGADAIFIGGTGGDTRKIVELCEGKLRSGGRIVIGIIMVETLFDVLNYLENPTTQKGGKKHNTNSQRKGGRFKNIDITQVTISKSRKVSTGTMMLARNPVTIVSATKQ